MIPSGPQKANAILQWRRISQPVLLLGLLTLAACNRPVMLGGSGLSYQGRSLEAWIEQLGGSFVPNEIYGSPPTGPALQAIDAIGAPAVPLLTASLASPNWWIRCAGAVGLGRLGSAATAAGPALAKLLSDSVEQVRSAAADALASIDPTLAVPLLTDSSLDIQIAAARAVLKGGVHGPAFDQAVQVLREGMKQHRYQAVQATGAASTNAVVLLPELRAALKDQSSEMSGCSVVALKSLGPAALPALPELVLLLRSHNVNEGGLAAQALGAIGVGVLPEVEPLFDDPDPDTRKMALWVIIQLGPKAASAKLPLDRLRNDPDETVRYNAAQAQQAIGSSKP